LLEAGAFEAAIRQARGTFDIGLDIGIHMDLLDIGGGIPGQEMENFSFHRPVASHRQTLSHNIVSSIPRHEWGSKSNFNGERH
jgi:diaminopimelate decarboxylase